MGNLDYAGAVERFHIAAGLVADVSQLSRERLRDAVMALAPLLPAEMPPTVRADCDALMEAVERAPADTDGLIASWAQTLTDTALREWRERILSMYARIELFGR